MNASEALEKVAEAMPDEIAFHGEMMLLRWEKSTSTDGPKLRFLLTEDADITPFEIATVRKGKVAGQRYMAIMVEIGDDELPIVQDVSTKPGKIDTSPERVKETEKSERGKRRWHDLTYPQQAGITCASADFQKWCGVAGRALPVDEAAAFVRDKCRVQSRSELLPDTNAGERWERLSGAFYVFTRGGFTTVGGYEKALRELGCIICGKYPSLHHIKDQSGGSMKGGWWEQVPLCHGHHQGQGGYHHSKDAFEAEHGTQHTLVMKAQKRLLE